MSGRLVLDTNAVIDLMDGNVSLRELVSKSDDVFIPSPVLGELYFGAHRSSQVAENVHRIDGFTRSYSVLVVDEATAKVYGALRHQLRLIGRPIPNNDLWIAAIAMQNDAQVTTLDQHFSSIPTLEVVGW